MVGYEHPLLGIVLLILTPGGIILLWGNAERMIGWAGREKTVYGRNNSFGHNESCGKLYI